MPSTNNQPITVGTHFQVARGPPVPLVGTTLYSCSTAVYTLAIPSSVRGHVTAAENGLAICPPHPTLFNRVGCNCFISSGCTKKTQKNLMYKASF
jgi:hypothetical protein